MTIKLNGQSREVASQSIEELLREVEAPRAGIAVALNGRVVRRGEMQSTLLQPNDEIEIIRAVQGG